MVALQLAVFTDSSNHNEYEHDVISTALNRLGLALSPTSGQALISLVILTDDNIENVKGLITQALDNGRAVICLVKRSRQDGLSEKVRTYLEGLPKPQSSKHKELGIISEGVELSEYTTLPELELGLQLCIGRLLTRLANRQIKFIEDPRTMYSIGTEVVENCRHRLIVVQQTPILFFGSRPYDKDIKEPLEDRYLKALEAWMDKCRQQDSSSQFLYFFDPDLSQKELKEIETTKQINLKPLVKERISKLIDIQKETQGRVAICPIERANALTIGDNWFGIWFMGKKAPLAYTYADPITSSKLSERFEWIAQTTSRNLSLEDILRQLDIT